jgi:hypothetical protein
MRRVSRGAPATVRVFRVGATYRLRAGGALVTAEDHEILEGRRTGRILVRAADVGGRMPVRWFSEPWELEDVDDADVLRWHEKGEPR